MVRLFVMAILTVLLVCPVAEAGLFGGCGMFGGNGFIGVRGRMAARREARWGGGASCGTMAPEGSYAVPAVKTP